MSELREKFVKQALSYMGIPYAKRYLTEDNPLYDSPIFLDCCGLIRQCVNDLREDFGFALSRWNQAYQFDLCPKAISFEELQKGDLIFYTATFYPEKKVTNYYLIFSGNLNFMIWFMLKYFWEEKLENRQWLPGNVTVWLKYMILINLSLKIIMI
jgi:hypothetical protein